MTEPPQLAGEYDLDISSFTNRELHEIKVETGVRAGEIEEAFAAGDNDLMVAITLIVLQRSGKGTFAQLRDAVWDLPAGSVQFDLTDEEKNAAGDDALPPTSGLDSSTNANGSSGSSGPDLSGTGDDPANGQSHIGSPLSDTGATSDPLTLAS